MESIIKLTCLTCGNRFEIDEDVEQFACTNCGTEYIVKRSGGIVRLVKAPVEGERARLRRKLERLESELSREMERELGGMPGYQLLRFDFAKIGKLHLQFAAVAPEKLLSNIFNSLSIVDLKNIAQLYAANPNSPTGAWLNRMCDLRFQIQEMKAQLVQD